MRFGVHLSVGGGLKRAVEAAVAMGCDTMQIFSSNPMGWRITPLDPHAAREFTTLTRAYGIQPIFLHTPYLVNLAAEDPDILTKSRATVRAALDRAALLGAQYVVTHIGSHKGRGIDIGIASVVDSLKEILHIEDRQILLLENTPGSGNEIGASFVELAAILQALPQYHAQLGICIDTAHLWGAGYDMATGEGVRAMLDELQREIGLKWLRLVHANDSSVARGSRHDVHEPPGLGRLGLEGFRALVNDPRLKEMSFILEMPRVESVEEGKAHLDRLRNLVEKQRI